MPTTEKIEGALLVAADAFDEQPQTEGTLTLIDRVCNVADELRAEAGAPAVDYVQCCALIRDLIHAAFYAQSAAERMDDADD